MIPDVYADYKIGDKRTAPGKEWLGAKDGMLGSYVDPNVWEKNNPGQKWDEAKFYAGGDGTSLYQNHMRKCFFIVKHPLDWLDMLKDGCLENGDAKTLGPTEYRAKKRLINYSTIETLTGQPGLEASLRDKSIAVDIFDATKFVLPESILKSSEILNPSVFDFAAVSAGTYTIGTGKNYTLWSDGYLDLANLTDALTFRQETATIETATSSITENLTNFTFTNTSNLPHYSDPTRGWLISKNFDGRLFDLQQEGPGILDIGNLRIKTITSQSAGAYDFYTSAIVAYHTINLHDLMWDGNNNDGSFIVMNDNTPQINVWNCVGWDTIKDAFWFGTIENTSVVENCVAYNVRSGFDATDENMTIRNCMAINCTTDFNNIGSATGNNNADTDGTCANVNWGTGSGNQPVLAIANEVVSVDDTSPDFMRPRRWDDSGNINKLWWLGTAPSIAGNNHGSDGGGRPGSDTYYSIGAREFITDIYYSLSPFGTGNIETGAGNISITDGVATLTVAQTGNIGIGCEIEYNSLKCYIMRVNSSTEFLVQTAVGATPANQGATAVTSIHHVWNGFAAFEVAYLGANYINNANLVTANVKAWACCYYDHVDYTKDIVTVDFEILGATSSITNHLYVYAPKGGTESINIQRHSGIYNANKYVFQVAGTGAHSILLKDNYVRFDGLQMEANSSNGSPLFKIESSAIGVLCEKCICRNLNLGTYGFWINIDGAGGSIRNTLVYDFVTAGLRDNYKTGTWNAFNCVFYNNGAYGFRRHNITLTVKNCANFNNTNDFDGTITISNCASDDGDGNSRPVTPANWATVFENYASKDFRLKSTDTDLAEAALDLSAEGFSDDIIGTSQPQGESWDIGAFERLVSIAGKLYGGQEFGQAEGQEFGQE